MCRVFALLLLLAGMVMATPVQAAKDKPSPAHDAILVLDASGLMWARMEGRPQISVPENVILGLLDGLSANYRLGLVAYGHRRKGDYIDIYPVGEDSNRFGAISFCR